MCKSYLHGFVTFVTVFLLFSMLSTIVFVYYYIPVRDDSFYEPMVHKKLLMTICHQNFYQSWVCNCL